MVQDQYVSKHNKLTHVYLVQTHQDIPVHNAMINMNIKADGSVLSMGNRFVADLATRVNTSTPQISMGAAVESLMSHFRIPGADAGLQIAKQIDKNEAVFQHQGLALEPIEVKLVYQPTANKEVRLAWNVTFYTLDAMHWYNARIDALDGKLLDYFDMVTHCEFGFEDHCPEDHAALHAAHLPEAKAENFFLPPGDEPGYRAYPIFVESPNHGERALHVNPADPIASPLGWHDTDGMEGAEFTITRGNNVHAYHDIFSINESSGDEPDGGDSLCFDFPLDLSLNQPYTQLDAHVTNLFYWNNLMHDVWYQYGFDEESGNFQENNYGNGGEDGDAVNAEALDGSGTNNANFSTPPDGGNGRMQMYLWGGNLPTFPDPFLTATAPEEAAGDYTFTPAGFGGQIPDADNAIIGEVIIVDDGVGETTDACEDIQNGEQLDGNIAMIDRGSCEFGAKALAAEELGAVAVIICNNVPDPLTLTMAPGAVGDQVTIPTLMVSQEDCLDLKFGLAFGLEVEISQPALEVPQPGPNGRGSDLDNGVIVHEYTHGISIRLTGGPDNSGCLNTNEQAGEGWSDWFALVMTTGPENFADEARGIGTFSAGQPTTGGGIRTYPYTRNMDTNPHTYADINNESVPHGVGSVFCATIWDMYWDLVDEYGFDEDLYYGTGGNNIAMQLVLDGLKLQPCSPSFIDARDAILEADVVNNDGANQCLIWNAFARRGIGFSAEPGGNEAFDLPNLCSQTYQVVKAGPSEANVGDIVTYELTLTNARPEAIDNAQVFDELPEGATYVEGSSDCAASFSDGILTFDLGLMETGEVRVCTYQVQMPDSPFTFVEFEEDVESGDDNWQIESPIGNVNWEVTFSDANTGFSSFFAQNIDASSDQQLISAPVTLDGANPALAFWHRYNTENDWDGGVIEVSTDGATWEDLGASITQNGYDDALNDNPDNPLTGRESFNGNSGGWIQTIVDLSSFSGSTIQVRWRLGCDALVDAEGWYVDDIQFFGDFYSVTNVACVNEGEEQDCSRVTTIIFGDPTSTNEINQEIGLTMAPNPTTGEFTLQLSTPTTKSAELNILSINGQLLLNQQFDSFRSTTIDMSNFGAGVYLVQLRTENGITTRKLVVE